MKQMCGVLTFNGDGQRVKSVMDGETTLFVGGHYEITDPGAGQTVTKYYMAGATRVAVRKGATLSYLLADHLGSTSLSTDSAGNRTSELRYKPWGETRFSFGTMPTKYTFTGQFSYTDDPSTEESEGFGLMYYNARWVDPSLGRFTQPDSIIPGTENSQSWDRYNYVGNNPVKNTDPDGHCFPLCTALGGAIVGAAVGVAILAIKSVATPGLNLSARDYAQAALVGGAAGLLIGAGAGGLAGTAMGAIYVGAGTGMATSAIAYTATSGDSYSSEEMTANALIGGVTGAAAALTGPAVVGANVAKSFSAQAMRAGITALGSEASMMVNDYYDGKPSGSHFNDWSGAATGGYTLGFGAEFVDMGVTTLTHSKVAGSLAYNFTRSLSTSTVLNTWDNWVDCLGEDSCPDTP